LLQKILFDSENVLGVEDGFDVEERSRAAEDNSVFIDFSRDVQ